MNIRRRISIIVLVIAGSYIANPASADSSLVENSPHFGDKGWDVRLGLGVEFASDSFYQGNDDDHESSFSIPGSISYYNNSFHFIADDREGLLFGYTLVRNGNWAIDALLSPRFSGPDDNELLDQLDEREIDLHAGFRYTTYSDNSLWRLELSQDVSDTHDGYIFSSSYEQAWQLRNWVITGFASIAFVSEEMADYYVGVDVDEATTRFPIYQAGDTVLSQLEIEAEYPVNENWVFRSSFEVILFDDEIRDSPVTFDGHRHLNFLSTGLVYHF